jgi:hypothetical protein
MRLVNPIVLIRFEAVVGIQRVVELEVTMGGRNGILTIIGAIVVIIVVLKVLSLW